MPRRTRVDAELVRRGLARSRQQAAELIGAGKVSIDGMPAVKPGTAVAVTAALKVADDAERGWVSRGAHKLIGALDAFGIDVEGRRCLDAGASTGGFTEVLLDRGAREVVAVDVGYGQLAWSLRSDRRVVVVERTNVRELTPEAIDGRVDTIVADLSFISLTTVLPALTGCAVGRRGYRSYGEAAVRGGQRASGGRRGRPQSRTAGKRGPQRRPARRRAGMACRRGDPQPAARSIRQR